MIAGTQPEYQSDAGSAKKTHPNLALAGELWGVFCDIFEKIDLIITAQPCI